jgi:hypothetical protein
VKGGKINHNHTLHLIITPITCAMWRLVWLTLYLMHKEGRLIVSVDYYGYVLRKTA